MGLPPEKLRIRGWIIFLPQVMFSLLNIIYLYQLNFSSGQNRNLEV